MQLDSAYPHKNGPDKNCQAGPILDKKLVRADHVWLTKNGPPRPILILVWPDQNSEVSQLSKDVFNALHNIRCGFLCLFKFLVP